jgi:hypothetical protein
MPLKRSMQDGIEGDEILDGDDICFDEYPCKHAGELREALKKIYGEIEDWKKPSTVFFSFSKICRAHTASRLLSYLPSLVDVTPALKLTEYKKHVKAIELLLCMGYWEKGKEFLYYRNKNGFTALHLAAEHGLLEVLNMLLEYGADVDIMDDEKCTPLMHTVACGGNVEVENMLLERGAHPYFIVSVNNGQCVCYSPPSH